MHFYTRNPARAYRSFGMAGLGEPAARPGVTDIIFRNKDRMHPDNCCKECQTEDPSGKIVRVPLGVGAFGTGKNVMELQFKLTGHRPNFEYDVARMKRKSTWERVGGKWNRLELIKDYTPDDAGNDDECHDPKSGSIFSMDAPGFPALLPRAHGMTLKAGGNTSSVKATDIVMRWSFCEFANARDKTQKQAKWFPISSCVMWHSVTWLTRNSANEWILDKTRSRIAKGTLSTKELDSAPKP